MNKNVIEVEELSKKYIIGEIGTGTISRDIERWVKTKILKKEDPFSKIGVLKDNHNDNNFVYSLQDLSFNIEQGDAVGIIGKNGAGKSTLLKIISRITSPTKGQIRIKGKITSLLEVGTGFHQELTGRENIYLNGSILGMKKKEIDNKFDEIVDFSGVSKYIDTPVKRYSSGMYIRLAFAVAANLDSDILIVDEVLAVGDSDFQNKCLGKMNDITTKEGKTILFVSHNMSAIKSLCNKALILHKGQKYFQGDVIDGISNYLLINNNSINNGTVFRRDIEPVNKKMYINYCELFDDKTSNIFSINLQINIISTIDYKASVNISIKDSMGFPIAYGCSHYTVGLYNMNKGENYISLNSNPLNLAIGRYKISLEVVDPGYEFYDVLDDIIDFEISNDDISNRKYGILQNWGKGAVELIIK
jgi:lipopolysaccharide transport system ATP-binding protein